MSLIQKMKDAKAEKPEAKQKSVPVRTRRPAPDKAKHYPSDNLAEGDGFVVSCVKLADNAPEESRGGSDFVHVSTLIGDKWCPRAHLIQSRHQQGQSSCVNSQLRIVWELGRAAEKHVRNQFIKMHGRHRVIGVWKCKCEQTEHIGPGTNNNLCPSCGTGTDTYNELPLIDPSINKTGNPDLIFIAKDDGLEVVEIKSIKKDAYELLFKADPDHVMQGRSYVNLLRDKLPGRRVNGRVLYVAKDYVRPNMSPYMEFPIKEDAASDEHLDALDDSVEDMRAHEVAGTLPDRLPSCSSPSSKKAKGCSACGLCFSL